MNLEKFCSTLTKSSRPLCERYFISSKGRIFLVQYFFKLFSNRKYPKEFLLGNKCSAIAENICVGKYFCGKIFFRKYQKEFLLGNKCPAIVENIGSEATHRDSIGRSYKKRLDDSSLYELHCNTGSSLPCCIPTTKYYK